MIQARLYNLPLFGFWRPYVKEVIYRYLDYGDLHFGFARVKCRDCGHEFLLPLSCKRRHFLPIMFKNRLWNSENGYGYTKRF
jgi:hypothetical protein